MAKQGCSKEGEIWRDNEGEEEEVLIFGDEEVEEFRVHCAMGRVVFKKVINRNSIQMAMKNIWYNPFGFKVEEVGDNMFQFFFDEETDFNKAMRGSPWLFRNSWLLLKEWKREIPLTEYDFSSVSVWIQFWGLPPHYRTKVMGFMLGSEFGEVIDADVFEIPGGQGSVVKAHVRMSVKCKVHDKRKIGSVKDGAFWVTYRYEKLEAFCYYCGSLEHEEAECADMIRDEGTGAKKDVDKGPWMKTNRGGWRVKSRSSGKECGSEGRSKWERTNNHQTQASDALIDQLSQLSVNEVPKAAKKQTGHTKQPMHQNSCFQGQKEEVEGKMKEGRNENNKGEAVDSHSQQEVGGGQIEDGVIYVSNATSSIIYGYDGVTTKPIQSVEKSKFGENLSLSPFANVTNLGGEGVNRKAGTWKRKNTGKENDSVEEGGKVEMEKKRRREGDDAVLRREHQGMAKRREITAPNSTAEPVNQVCHFQ